MAGEEGEVVPGPAVQVVVEVLQNVDDIEGEPAEHEHHQDGHQQFTPPPVREISIKSTINDTTSYLVIFSAICLFCLSSSLL